MKKVTYMGHPAHFCEASRCRFFLSSHVNGFIVSTVGELVRAGKGEFDFTSLSADPGMFYETKVFHAKKAHRVCCPFTVKSLTELDGRLYKTADEATKGHHALLAKWAKKRKP